MLLTLLIIPLASLTILGLVWVLSRDLLLDDQGTSKYCRSSIYDLLKLVTLVSLFANLLYSSYLWKHYPFNNSGNAVSPRYPASVVVGDTTLLESSHNLNLPFIILSTAVLIVAMLTAWYSSVNMLLFCSMVLLVEMFLIGAFSCTSIFVFLLFFEASALPIFILVAYCGSARRERLKASYYFLFFTLYGSLALLLLILNFYSLSQIGFAGGDFLPTQSSNPTIWLLLFVAFAVKIPLFPFHIWLPYAHVEASTPTSIILAALMLKLGGYGVLKFMLPLFTISTHLFFRPFALFICVFGAVYGGLAALRQIDMKRQIAFSSISHMSFATIGVFTFTEIGAKGSVYLMLSHGLTSSALFYLIGILSDRYHTRSVMAFSGLLSSMPTFSFFLIVMSLANVGFPGTSGFLPELLILVSIVSSISAMTLPVLLGMLLTTASSLVLLLRVLFGHTKVLYSKSNWVDVTRLEFFILFLLTCGILGLGMYDVLSHI